MSALEKFTLWLRGQSTVTILFFGLVVVGIYAFLGILWLHRKFPKTHLIGWIILGFLLALAHENWVTAGLFLVVPALAHRFIWKKYEPKYLARKQAKQFKQTVIALMEQTLWNPEQFDAKKFVTISETDRATVKRVDFRTPMGQADDAVLKILPVFSAWFNLSDPIVLPDANSYDGFVSTLFCEVSPLEEVLDAETTPVLNMVPGVVDDPYLWLPVGTDANGSDYSLPLFLEEGGSVRQLCAGTSGSGKSSIVRQQLLQAVANRYIDVWITDGKGSEFGIFQPYVQQFSATPKQFWALLKNLEQERDRRASTLNENKALALTEGFRRRSQSWNHQDDGNFLLWVRDELGATMAGFTPQQKSEAMNRLYGVLSVGRSLGIGIIFSSQTFKADLLSTQIRDNCFDVSLGFKMNSIQEGSYIGFEPDDEVHPARIKGKILPSGKSSTVGTFAIRGIDRNAYGRSYYISDEQINAVLATLEPLAQAQLPATSSPSDEEEDAQFFERELEEINLTTSKGTSL